MTNWAEQNIQYTLSTQAVEHIIPSKEALLLCEKLSEGKINANAAVDTIKLKYGVEGRSSRG